jgi:hypothetical protein
VNPDARLNKTEVWIAGHSIRIFLVIAALILVGAFFVVKTFLESGETAKKVKVIAPQVTRINRALCDERSLDDDKRARRCAERIRVGLVNCRRSTRCRAALLAAITYPPPARPAAPEGGDSQSPPKAGQQPAPGQPGDGNKGAHHGHGSKPPKPSPAPTPAPAPETGSPAAPEHGDEDGDSQGQDEPKPTPKGGVEVEVCLFVTCAEVGVGG